MEQIVIGYDGSDDAKRALERTRTFADVFGARVTAVCALGPAPASQSPPASGIVAVLPASEDAERQCEQALAEAEAFLAEVGIVCDARAVTGEPGDMLLEVAEEVGADLIVTGTREPGFVERLLVGSVSEEVSRRAPCDVLIVR